MQNIYYKHYFIALLFSFFMIVPLTTFAESYDRNGGEFDEIYDPKYLIEDVIYDVIRTIRRDRDRYEDNKAKENGRKILQAARDFYEHLYDEEYFKSIQVGLLMQIDRLMIQKKKKCIWFTCIDNLWIKKNWSEYYPNFIPKSGPYGNEALYDISMSEDDIPDLERIGFDPRINHFNAQNNINMANLIINIIETNNFSPHEIKMEDYFEVLK